jgi:hypothetical protein
MAKSVVVGGSGWLWVVVGVAVAVFVRVTGVLDGWEI